MTQMDTDEFKLPGSTADMDRRHALLRHLDPMCRPDLWRVITRSCSALACLLIVGISMAQSSGKLHLRIDPPNNFTYKLDHRFTMQKSELELLEGAHHFSFWAPERRIVDTTLTIAGGEDKTFSLRLPFSTEYLVHQRDTRAFRKDRQVMRLIPAAATGVSLLYTAVRFGKMKKAHDKLDEDRNTYNKASSPNAITVLKNETIPAHKDDFSKARTGYQVAAGVTVLFAGATTYLYLRSAKRKKPVFNDTEKVRFDGLSWTPGANGGAWTGGLTWNFAR